MPPLNEFESKSTLNDLIKSSQVVVFSKTKCPYCMKVKSLFKELNVEYNAIELDLVENGNLLHKALKERIERTSVPQIYINGTHVGGCMDTYALHDEGKLLEMLKTHHFDYDLIVIGGGSGGLAASKEAVKLGRRVAILDFVTPTPHGTTWGLGGTCVNVGCIPKKLMHQAAIVGQMIKDSQNYGWQTNGQETLEMSKNVEHNWLKMIENVQNKIKSLNFNYRIQMKSKKIDYFNAYGTLEDNHRVKLQDKKNKISYLTADKFIIATGERPKYPDDCPGAKEYGITSDDLFSLPYSPGKTLVIGASYVALECAGFLNGIGYDVTVMIRSIFLRGFDQEIAEQIGAFMAEEGVKFLRPCIPVSIEQIEAGQPGLLKVTGKMGDGDLVIENYNTVIFAIGRKSCTDNIGLENIGVKVGKNGKIPTINEQTNVPNIYAIGDILEGKPELTPVAIEAGVLLARRLFGNSNVLCDYINVPTTVFTPIEYGSVGYSEETAVQKWGADNIEVYFQYFTPLEWTIAHRTENKCYAKLLCVINENERCVGFHYLGPNAGEVTQLAGLVLKKSCTKSDFDALIGIHPTCAEIFTTLSVTKRNGLSGKQDGC